MSVDPRRTSPFCTPRCYRECRCSRWPDYKNRFGEYVVPHDDTVVWTPALPLPVSGLLPDHWYISDGPLWQDAGITPAAADGDPVGRWEDITANADHVNQAVVASKPTLQNGAGDLVNGHPVVRFDGTSDGIKGAFTTGGAIVQPLTIFAVAALDAASVNDDVYNSIIDGDDAVNRIIVGTNGVAVPDAFRMYAGISFDGAAANSNWNIWTVLANGASSQFWHNGISQASGNAGANGIDGLTIGSRWDIGSNYWDGDVTEVLIYGANLSNLDKNEVGAYLAARYALAYTDI